MNLIDYDEKQKERCCAFLDEQIIPRYEHEMEQRQECADVLDDFLIEEELTYEDFYHYILFYSLGYGLDYLEEVNYMIPLLYPTEDRNEMEYDEQDT